MIIFLYGADTFRSRRFLSELKDKFIREVDPSAASLEVLAGQTMSFRDIGEKINTGSLFVKKRLIVIENIFKNKSEKTFSSLANYLKKFSDDENNIIIFREEETIAKNRLLRKPIKNLFNFLSKQTYSQEFLPLNNKQIITFITQEAKSYKRKITPIAASLLMSLSDNNLWSIAHSIKKLAFYTKQETITPAQVRETVVGSYDKNIFGLTDALSTRNRKLAINLLEEQYAAGLSQEYLISMLIRQFKILLQIRSALDQNMSPAEIQNKLKFHPFVIKKGLIQAKNFSLPILKNYLNRLINLDFLNKTGGTNIKTELAWLISKL